MQLPYVFILDWDGTIAGKVDFQSHAFTIRTALRKLGYKTSGSQQHPPKAFNPSSKLIRPGFASFMKGMRDMFGAENVHFFIYTASDRVWANQEIQWVERAHGIRFERPIFTRDDCTADSSGTYRKSIMRIWPRICRKLQLTAKNAKDYVLHNQLIVIDNNAVYTDLQDRLLLCPDYSYAVFEHLLDIIPHDARKHPHMQNILYSLINMGVMCPLPKHDDHMDAITASYSWIADKCKNIVHMNKAYAQDDFWKYLRKLIAQNELRKFTPNIIKQLQEAVWKRVRKSSSALT